MFNCICCLPFFCTCLQLPNRWQVKNEVEPVGLFSGAERCWFLNFQTELLPCCRNATYCDRQEANMFKYILKFTVADQTLLYFHLKVLAVDWTVVSLADKWVWSNGRMMTGKPNYSEKNMSECICPPQTPPHMDWSEDWSELEPRSPWWEGRWNRS